MGHKDGGKSTLAGRLLFDLGLVSPKVIDEYREQAQLLGKATFEFAWVMDLRMEERFRGLTIVPSYRKLTLDGRKIILVDGPGHQDFAKSMILAIAESDVGLLVVDSLDVIKRGVLQQTYEHSVLARAFGIDQLVVVVNKMDLAEIAYDSMKYEAVVDRIRSMLIGCGYAAECLLFVPASAYLGANVTKRSNSMPWYRGQTVLEALRWFSARPRRADLPFRMPVDEVLTVKGAGTVVTGKVACGTVAVHDTIVVCPGNLAGRVRSIEEFHQPVKIASAGDDIGIAIPNIQVDAIRRGSVVGATATPPVLANRLLVRLRVVDPPSPVHEGYAPTLHVHSAVASARVDKLISRIDPQTRSVIERPPELTSLSSGHEGYAEIEMLTPVVIEGDLSVGRLSNFVLRDQGHTVAVGTCVDVLNGDGA